MKNKTLKYHYDQESGIFVKEDELSANWLVSEVLKKPNAQITKLTNEDIQTFLTLINDLRMPDGRHCYVWLKERLSEIKLMTGVKLGKSNEELTDKYRYLIEQIDLRVVGNPDALNKVDPQKIVLKPNRTPNNMEIRFE